MTAPFVLAPAGVLLLARDLRARDWRATTATAAMGASWLALFAVSMTIVIAPETQNDMSTRFWTWAFVPVGQPAFAAEWMIRRAFDLFDETVGFHEVGGLALALCLLGIGRMAGERRWTTLALLLGPLACAFLAALAQSYPFHGRLLHFALPGIVILTAAGLVEAASRLSAPAGRDARRRGTALAVTAALALLLILPGARQTLTQAARTTPPFDREGAEVVLERLLARRGPEEVLYLHSKAVAPALRYAEREGLSLAPVIYGHDPLASPEHFLADLEALPEHGRVWVVIGGGWLAANAPTATWASTTVLRQYGEPVERLHHEATKAYLYDFTAAEGARPDIIRRPLPPYHPDQSGDWPDARAD